MKKAIVDKLETFHNNVEIEKMMAQDNGDIHVIVEAPREIIEYLNRGKMLKAFDKVGFCINNGVIVCGEGKKDEVLQQIEDSNTLGPSEIRRRAQ